MVRDRQAYLTKMSQGLNPDATKKIQADIPAASRRPRFAQVTKATPKLRFNTVTPKHHLPHEPCIITKSQLRRRAELGWVALDDGNVYDLSRFARTHPGGEHIIRAVAGRDAADLFHAFHPNIPTEARAHAMLKNMPVVARLCPADREDSALHRDFAALRAALEREGWYDTSYAFYAGQAAWLSFLFGLACTLTLHAHTLAHTLAAAAASALFLQQTAFVGHDAGHSAITHRRGADRAIGLVVGPLLTGLSISWWRDSHNTHHVVTNEAEHDPDIQHLPVLCVSKQAVARGELYSTYHRKRFVVDALATFFILRQAVLFVPLLALSRFNLYLQSFAWFWSWRVPAGKRQEGALELALMTLHHACAAAVALRFASWPLGLTWYLGTNCLASVLNLQIVSSHFGMDIVADVDDLGADAQFLRQQLVTTTDIKTTAWTAWFFGGLEHQVAHHVCPRVPRHNLARLASRLKVLCERHGLEYREDSFAGILRGVRGALAAVSQLEVIK